MTNRPEMCDHSVSQPNCCVEKKTSCAEYYFELRQTDWKAAVQN